MTYCEFYGHMRSLPEKFQNRDLEIYLSALYSLVIKNCGIKADADLLLMLIESAFTSEPAPFDEEWLQIQDSPDVNIMSRKFTNPEIAAEFDKSVPEIAAEFDKSVMSELEGFEFTLAVIRFQIAELHKMRNKQLINKYRFFGIDSETGNRWYNFDPFANLACGAACLEDNFGEETDSMIVNWQTLGELLEMGRIYE